MRKFLGKGVCQKCGANEVIAQSGSFLRCSRCFPRMWQEIAGLQKSNYLEHGSVWGPKRIRNYAK